MGYRTYFYKISNKSLDGIRKMPIKELYKKYGYKDDDYKYIDIHCLPIEQLYEFGKYTEFDTQIIESGNPLFFEEDIMNEMEDYNPFIVGEKAFLIVIEHYRQKVINNYETVLGLKKDVFSFKKITNEERMKKYMEGNLKEWNHRFIPPYNLDRNKKQISDSWRYEYSIFELVRIYKDFDFKNDSILFMGY